MTNKLKYFIGNWKMFGDFNSFKIISKINQYAKKHKSLEKSKIVLCVPNILIDFFNKKLKSKSISIGAQNCYHEEGYGPFTGAISAVMLKKMGAEYIILGHSENREEGETLKLIKKKVIAALNQKLNIILCVGEKFIDKKKGKTFTVIKKQIKGSLEKKFNINKIILAYEPVWSIGTNKIPNSKELMNVIKFIKKDFKKIFKTKNYPKVLYGGSVNKNNIRLLSSLSEIDGFLIGGASQSSKKFIDIIKNYYK
jgi:triosephosphate isomerase